jgi:predicted small secreted protein
MKNLLVVLVMVLFSAGLSACNTVKGFGKDVERGGEKVQETSDNVRK